MTSSRPRLRRRAALAALVSLAAAHPGALGAAESAAFSQDRHRAVEALLFGEMSRLGIPGLSAAIVVDGELRFTGGYGLADLENSVPATSETVYRLASVSKPITAVAVLQLADAGRLDLDAPIQTYVPSFVGPRWRITARQLLGHLGGIRHYTPGEFESTRHYSSLRDGLTIFASDASPYEPGTRFLYSTYGYNLLGAAVEGASGMEFIEYLRRNVFEPAGMERTRADDVQAIIPHRASGYVRRPTGELGNSALADTSYKVPGGGLVAPAGDVARFAAALMTGRLLRPHTFEEMLKTQRTKDGQPTGYGLGWNVGERGSHREAWHRGAQQRVSSVLYLKPDRKAAVVVLANLEGISSGLPELARKIADAAAP